MTSNFQQAQAEGLCLRYPENLPLHREINYETAVNMLLRATAMSTSVPFAWGFVDKPPEGQVLLLFLPTQSPFPNDGLRFQEQEVKFTMSAGNNRELEVHEVKFGFVPGGQDSNAWRCRRRYRLIKGGNPSLVLVHYTQGPQAQIVPSMMNHPVRNYPLRIVNEPSVYVAGEKMGQKVYPAGGPMQSSAPAMQQPGKKKRMPMNFSQQQAMVAQQNTNMELLDQRRREQEQRVRAQASAAGGAAGRPPRPEDDDSGDEIDHISTRTLALNRYKRNHDMMNEVFQFAAYGDKHAPPPPRPYSIFDKNDIEQRTAKLREEVEVLKASLAELKAARQQDRPDVVMTFGDDGIIA
ncbi:SWI/SNF and RSC complexes subunit ssr4 [Termitomyces sp. J132]|nr:SWI/SNF and RSC complexes subunit ssr4 [Termitomyces sp. J132]